MSFYRERFGHREGEFPVCEDVAARSIALPFFPEMTQSQVEQVADALAAVLEPCLDSGPWRQGLASSGLQRERRQARWLGAFGFAAMLACPVVLFHDVVAVLAEQPQWSELQYLTGWTPWVLLAGGLLFLLPVAWSAGMNPESRLFPRARAAYAGWGVTLYLLGFLLAWQVARIQGVGAELALRGPHGPLLRTAGPGLPGARHARWASTGGCGRTTSRSRAPTPGCSPRRAIIAEADRDALHAALEPVEVELAEDRFPFADDDVDIHMAIERRVTELAGPVGGKIHTARSRNDQVATDVAMFVRDERARRRSTASTDAHARARRRRPRQHLDWPLPGYTHLQRGQPVYLVAPPARLRLDARARPRAAALRLRAGRPPAARRRRAGGRELRHRPRRGRRASSASRRVMPNSIDAVSNRDFVLDFLAAAATCLTHLSRLGSELVLWSTRRVRLRRAARRVDERLVDHAAEEEPRRGRAAARQGAARVVGPRRGSTACCTRSR